MGCSNRSKALTASEGRVHQQSYHPPRPLAMDCQAREEPEKRLRGGVGCPGEERFGGGWMGLSILQGLGMSHGTLEGKMWLFIPN